MDGLEQFMRRLLAVGFDTQSALARGFDYALYASQMQNPGLGYLRHCDSALFQMEQVTAKFEIDREHQTKGSHE